MRTDNVWPLSFVHPPAVNKQMDSDWLYFKLLIAIYEECLLHHLIMRNKKYMPASSYFNIGKNYVTYEISFQLIKALECF